MPKQLLMRDRDDTLECDLCHQLAAISPFSDSSARIELIAVTATEKDAEEVKPTTPDTASALIDSVVINAAISYWAFRTPYEAAVRPSEASSAAIVFTFSTKLESEVEEVNPTTPETDSALMLCVATNEPRATGVAPRKPSVPLVDPPRRTA